MTSISNTYLTRLCMALALMLLGFASFAAEAKQTSLDSRIFQAFEKIDGRTNAHEKSVVEMRARLDQLSAEMSKLHEQLAERPMEDDAGEQQKRRRLLTGQMINLSAEYLSQSYKLVDSAAKVISENLSDLARLANEVRKSGDPTGGAGKLQNRIQRNIAAGRSMRNALVDLRNWARKDHNLASRFNSLQRMTSALDRKITFDKARLTGRHTDTTGGIRNKRLEALDQTVNRLGDMYAQVAIEKEAIKDLRDEVAIAIQLGRLEMTQEVAERAIPSLGSVKTPSTGAKPLNTMATVIADFTDSLVDQADETLSRKPSAPGQPEDLEVRGFSNF